MNNKDEALRPDLDPNRVPNDDEVICPNCTHQFRAIPVNVQAILNARPDLDPAGGEEVAELIAEADGWEGPESYEHPSLKEAAGLIGRLAAALAHPAPAAEPESPYELLRNPIP